ncbi:MAG: AAA family ATPase [Atopobiaceae bacterium]|jgi:hypothetical protein|nr:AAA family ATPase [Atopobiaceae bacterium]
MGTYLNPGSAGFEEALGSEIYVDKTGMLSHLNALLGTRQKYVSVSRPRRFGKTTAADMVCAYYDRTADSRALFEGTLLAGSAPVRTARGEVAWDGYLGGFDVIRLVMTDFFGRRWTVDEGLPRMTRLVLRDLLEEYPDVDYFDKDDFVQCMQDVYAGTRRRFVVVIDEWDCVFRERKNDRDGQRAYLDFLRDWLKDKQYIALAYITGILPIKKYGKHSALNMFDEYSMTQPMRLAPYTGFTKEEVVSLCDEFDMSYEEISSWYDGYRVSDWIPVGKRRLYRQGEYEEHRLKIFSPLSVVKAMRSGEIDNYWNETETYEALRQYIDWDFDGLKEDVTVLMDGGRVRVDISGYQNDMTTFHGKDDILTMLIHLGYLSYDRDVGEVFIPNREVMDVFRSSTRSVDWTATFRALRNSQRLLEATWACDEDTVAELLEAAHDRAGNGTYHSEAGLSYAVQLAYYRARDYYTVVPELDSGKGYVDLAYIPKAPNVPALLIELKYDKSADSAIAQIRRQNYPDRLEHYRGNLILVGIDYDKTARSDGLSFKHHSCVIERA